MTRAFLPLLRRSPHPHLVFTASSSVLGPASRLGAYQATKFAVLGLAETLHIELAADGIGVSVVFPSGMMTRHLESSLAARPGTIADPIAPDDDLEAMLASNPGLVRDAATAEDAARYVVDDVLAGERYIVTHGDLVEEPARVLPGDLVDLLVGAPGALELAPGELRRLAARSCRCGGSRTPRR